MRDPDIGGALFEALPHPLIDATRGERYVRAWESMIIVTVEHIVTGGHGAEA